MTKSFVFDSIKVTKPIYNWPRFWVPLGKSVPLDGAGFLHDPENEYAHYYYTEYQPQLLQQLAPLPVAILLGEPGMGKSTTLNDEFLRLQTTNEPCLYRKLNEYHSDSRLIDNIFNAEELQAWRHGHHHLTLLLDSVDECSLTIPNVARILVSQLKGLQTNRLTLRLTCRTADWPVHITDELRKLWSIKDDATDPVGVFELAPLREKDILCAATALGLDSNAFSAEVQLKEIQPLASHPNTLNMLFGLFGRPDGLPKKRSELYQLGCETLAAERNTFRQESRLVGKLNARQRMAVAGRIAAQMIFGHRSAIWRGDDWDAEAADLIESNVLGELERADGQDFLIDSHAFQETIECALFSGRGENRIGFAHQSYVEFLAAWYLYSRKLDSRHTLPLLLHPDDKRVPPQHAETAIWLAALDGDIFTALVQSEPLLLLRTDLSDTSDEQRAYLTAVLLKAFATKTEFDRDWGLRQHYRKLAHPTLADQLRPYIVDQELFHTARNAALEIAAACTVRELVEDILSVALNQHEAHYLRSSAAQVATELADSSRLAKLRPVALGEAGNDPEDRLKSYVIPALWPTHISTKEVFDLLLQTQNAQCLGKYRYMPQEFVEQFSADDLIVALQWIVDIGKARPDYEADCLKDAIMVAAGNKLDEPCVLNAFAETVWTCLDRYERIFNRRGEREDKNWLVDDGEKRRSAIIALLRTHSSEDTTRDPVNLIVGENSVILPQDATWLLECYRLNTYPELRVKLAKCIDFFLRWDAAPAWIDAVISTACDDATKTDSPLAETVTNWMEPIWLDSEIAHTLKAQYIQQMEWQRKKPLSLDPPPPVRVEEALQEFESGKHDAWMRLWKELFLPDEATQYSWSGGNITKSPGWQRATQSERLRILACAEEWIKTQQLTQSDISQPNNSISYRHTATYLALRLLFDANIQTLLTASPDIWKQWARALIAYPFDQDHEQRIKLIQLAYEMAPDDVLEAFRYLIDKEIETSQPPHKVEELATVWDARVAALLHEFMEKPGLLPEQTAALLNVLLVHSDETAFEFAYGLVRAMDNQPLALVAAKVLIGCQTRRGWQVIWAHISGNVSFGKELMLGLVNYSHRRNSILAHLSELEIADLYFWLEQHFPTSEDTHYPSGEAHTITARDEVGRLRDHCPSYLSSLGTKAAVDALWSICERESHKDWLKYLHNQAQQAFRKTTLQALSPSELIAYTHRRDVRLARSSRELMEAVLFSLQRFQDKLQGQTPFAFSLWDEHSGQPKSEDRLTDSLKHHLEGDLPTFVIDREVQIRNLRDHGIGERTDLKIETKDQDGRSISIIIESKGCWNEGLMTSMKSQLFDRYLQLANESYGIYLVGWFRCDRWKGKKNCVFQGTKEELLTELTAQAKSLSGDSGRLSAFVLDATY